MVVVVAGRHRVGMRWPASPRPTPVAAISAPWCGGVVWRRGVQAACVGQKDVDGPGRSAGSVGGIEGEKEMARD